MFNNVFSCSKVIQFRKEKDGVIMVNWWLLIGILIIVVGFGLKIDSIAVVIVAAIVTALIGGIGFKEILSTL